MNTLDQIAEELKVVRRNQELTIRMVQSILKELGLRKEIRELEEEMEASDGADHASPVGG